MVYTENHMTWAQCDKCYITMFVGFNSTKEEVMGMEKQGWTIGKQIICPACNGLKWF